MTVLFIISLFFWKHCVWRSNFGSRFHVLVIYMFIGVSRLSFILMLRYIFVDISYSWKTVLDTLNAIFQRYFSLNCRYLTHYDFKFLDSDLLYSRWPQDSFAMVKSKDGCPRGFTESSVKQNIETLTFSDPLYSEVTVNNNEMVFKFCSKPRSNMFGNDVKWSPGSYCFLNFGGSCPSGMILNIFCVEMNNYVDWDLLCFRIIWSLYKIPQNSIEDMGRVSWFEVKETINLITNISEMNLSTKWN